mmetsp:Transcript_32142/g.92265  ORF Transcript_32142/g.92265 Transcript_32142/m.92265 type:complete len:480 (-) Transcript_32142:96-1535(-)
MQVRMGQGPCRGHGIASVTQEAARRLKDVRVAMALVARQHARGLLPGGGRAGFGAGAAATGDDSVGRSRQRGPRLCREVHLVLRAPWEGVTEGLCSRDRAMPVLMLEQHGLMFLVCCTVQRRHRRVGLLVQQGLQRKVARLRFLDLPHSLVLHLQSLNMRAIEVLLDLAVHSADLGVCNHLLGAPVANLLGYTASRALQDFIELPLQLRKVLMELELDPPHPLSGLALRPHHLPLHLGAMVADLPVPLLHLLALPVLDLLLEPPRSSRLLRLVAKFALQAVAVAALGPDLALHAGHLEVAILPKLLGRILHVHELRPQLRQLAGALHLLLLRGLQHGLDTLLRVQHPLLRPLARLGLPLLRVFALAPEIPNFGCVRLLVKVPLLGKPFATQHHGLLSIAGMGLPRSNAVKLHCNVLDHAALWAARLNQRRSRWLRRVRRGRRCHCDGLALLALLPLLSSELGEGCADTMLGGNAGKLLL